MEDAGWRSWGPTAGATINWGRGADFLNCLQMETFEAES